MQGRHPKGMFVEEFGAPVDGTVGRWYRDTRVADVVGTGWVETGDLYRAADGDAGAQRYLAVYETDRWDMEDILEELDAVHRPRWARDPRQPAGFEVERARILRRCGPPVPVERSGFVTERSGQAPVTGLLVVWSRCTDAAREKPFHRWYNLTQAPSQLADGAFHTAYRYASAFREPTGERWFMALYETDAPDPVTAVTDRASGVTDGLAGPGVPDYVDFLGRTLYVPV